MPEPHQSSSESSVQATSSKPHRILRRPGRSIQITEYLKFEVYSDDSEDEDQIRKRLGLDDRYPIGPSGRPVAGSKRVAKAHNNATSMDTDHNKPSPGESSEVRALNTPHHTVLTTILPG
jgi:hypothetical protein